jgi:hypothetical protein
MAVNPLPIRLRKTASCYHLLLHQTIKCGGAHPESKKCFEKDPDLSAQYKNARLLAEEQAGAIAGHEAHSAFCCWTSLCARRVVVF